MEEKRWGATEQEWESVEKSALMPWVLPTVCNPDLPKSEKSHMPEKSRGKVPSIKNKRGEVCGFPKWTEQPFNKDLNAWKTDPDLGFVVRTGVGGIIGIDCDCDDLNVSRELWKVMRDTLGLRPPIRRRGNARWATLLILSDGASIPRQIWLLPNSGMLELRGTGNCLACCGTHPSGKRYEWVDGSVGDIPTVKRADFNKFLATLDKIYQKDGQKSTKSRNSEQKTTDGKTREALQPDELAEWLFKTGKVLGTGRLGQLHIRCPWEHLHTTNDNPSSTSYFPVGANGYKKCKFRCFHAHCSDRKTMDFIRVCRESGFVPESEKTASDNHSERKKSSAMELLEPFVSEKTGEIKPTPTSLDIALRDPELMGFELGFDSFSACEVLRRKGADWEPFGNETIGRVRQKLEAIGFKPPSSGDVGERLQCVAHENVHDSMLDFLNQNIPQWDETPRIGDFFETYCEGERSEWNTAVAYYLFTALWGRASSPDGIKCDISPVLVGRQGCGKSTLAKILAMREEWFGEVNFELKPEDMAREMRQKIVMEIPELGGMTRKEQNDVKAFMTRTHDSWIPKYQERAMKAARRCIFVMTTNDREFLTDSTGNRRWAPVEVGQTDRERLKRDMPQLMAEARTLYEVNGILFEQVERLQEEINKQYLMQDPWHDAVKEWLEYNPVEKITSKKLFANALNRNDYTSVTKREQNELGKVMRALGWELCVMRDHGRNVKCWRRQSEKTL